MISNGTRTEWSPIRPVIIRVINKIAGVRFVKITSMITDRIGQHEVLLSINHTQDEMADLMSLKGFLKIE